MPRMCAREIDQAFADEPSLDNGQSQEEILDDEYDNWDDYKNPKEVSDIDPWFYEDYYPQDDYFDYDSHHDDFHR